MKTSVLKKRLLATKQPQKTKSSFYLSSGSTKLNLAMSDRPNGCFIKGKFHSIVGDSDTGKSVLALTILTEAAIDPNFKNYQLVLNNAERGMIMDLGKYFPPLEDKLVVVESKSPEHFYYHLNSTLDKGPTVYILDSMDSLVAEAEEKKFAKAKRAHEQGKEAAGSFGFKAKINAQHLPRICGKLKKDGSILIIISQTHDNIGAVMFGPKKTRSGGHALKFYNRGEIWLSLKKTLTKSYKGKNIQIGSITEAQVKKNHITGKKRRVDISIFNSYGVDDVGDCIDFLLEWGRFKKSAQKIKVPEFAFEGTREKLIDHIEAKERRVERLKQFTAETWKEIEDAIEVKRKPKYS